MAEQHGAAPVEPIDAVLAAAPAPRSAPGGDGGSSGAEVGWSGWLEGVLEATEAVADVQAAAPVSLQLDGAATATSGAEARPSSEVRADGAVASERESDSEREGSSDEDLQPEAAPGVEFDAAEVVLMQTEMMLKLEAEMEAMEQIGLRSDDVCALVRLEAQRDRALGPAHSQVCLLCVLSSDPECKLSSNCILLPTLVAALLQATGHSDLVQADASLRVPAPDVRHVLLFGCHPDTMRLLTYSLLACFDVPCVSTCGYLVSAATPAAHQLHGDNNTNAASLPLTPVSLAVALGLGAGATPADGSAVSHDWLNVSSSETIAAGTDAQAVPWYARSPERHAFARTALLQMLAPGGSLSEDVGLIRALFHVEGTPILRLDETGSTVLETAAAAGARARASAKRWLQEPMLARSLTAWSAFAALEERCGRHKQALKVAPPQCYYTCAAQTASICFAFPRHPSGPDADMQPTSATHVSFAARARQYHHVCSDMQVLQTAMAAADTASAEQRPLRWTLALQAALLEFAAAGMPWTSERIPRATFSALPTHVASGLSTCLCPTLRHDIVCLERAPAVMLFPCADGAGFIALPLQ